LLFLTQNISAIANKSRTSSVLTLRLASSAVSNLSLQKSHTAVQLTASITLWDRFYQEIPCFIQSSDGTSAVLPA